MKIKHLILGLLLSSVIQLNGQDFHNSFFQFAPMTVNPALTGAFYGNLRANVIGRDQGRTVSSGNGWQDLSLAIDYNIDFGLTKDDWISVGVNFVRSSSAGAGDFRRQFSGLAGSYHLAFGKKSDKVFTLGVKYGTYKTLYTGQDLTRYSSPHLLATSATEDSDINQILAGTLQIDPAAKAKSDYTIGLMLDAPMGKTADIRIGVAMDHLFSSRLNAENPVMSQNPMDTVGRTTIVGTLDKRLNAFVFYYTDINKKLTFNPNLLIHRQGVTTGILAQALFHYLYSEEKDISLIAGLGVRVANSMDIPIYLGVDMNTLRVALSYDANITGLSPSTNTFGALELGITKIFNWNKKTVVKPVFICPRL